MKTVAVVLLFLIVSLFSFSQTQSSRPKIGLTLSGGAAKGLAHIGILKAIDSAGLRVDYVTGTSMGSIMGGLYAVGYSGDSLEKICTNLDWGLLFSNQSSLRSLFMEEKEEYSKYDIELPWVNHRLKLTIGLLEAQELWLKLSELFFPVYNEKDFSKFSMGFRCVATDVGNGNAVVLKDGEIVSAIRASMAIPSVFTAVDYDGKKLVDGGISRNFPAKDVKDMGSDFIIGSNVAGGLLPSEKVRNIIQLLLQIAFFREAEDTKKEIPLCDIYIPVNLENFSMGSFNDADKIINIGIEEGKRMYPRFKQLADSLNAIYGNPGDLNKRLPPVRAVKISSAEVLGLKKTTSSFFLNTTNLKTGRSYTAKEISNMVRQAFGTRYYNRIVYSLIPQEDGSCKIIFNAEETPFTYLKASLHYNNFSGIGVIGNLTTRNFFTSNSRSMVSVNIGESLRAKAEHLQYIGRRKDFGITLKGQFDRFDITTYEQNKQTGLYKQNYSEVSEKFHFSPTRSFTVGVGHRFEWVRYVPTIPNKVQFRGNNTFSTLFGYIKFNSLDRNIFPRKGIKIDVEAARVLRQHPNIRFLIDGLPPDDPDSIQVDKNPYDRLWFSGDGYLSFTNRTTFSLHSQLGINFNYSGNLMNEFVVGGITKIFRNQVNFVGLQEGSVYSPAVFSAQGAIRQNIFNNAYISARANILLNNFISLSDYFDYRDFYSGYALTFSYNFALGPLDLSVMYCDQTKKVQTYINLGIPF